MKSLKIGAYIRVSTDEQAKVYEGSLESQKYRIKEFVKYKNSHSQWGDIVDFYIEEGESAGSTNRPVYQRLLADVRAKKVNLILVTDLSRLSRNLLDFCNLINELEEYNASYHSMKEQFDTTTPIGRMMVYIIIALGQFEREQTSERVATNFFTRAVKGLLNGGPTPLGYDRNPESPGILEVNEKEADMVRVIFNTFLEEGSRSKAASKLREMGIFLKKPDENGDSQKPVEFNVQTLGNLLKNMTYIGIREVNKCYKEQDPSNLKPWQQYSMVQARWPGIVDISVFNDVQLLLEEAAEKERVRWSKAGVHHFLLSGLLVCGETGLPLVGQSAHGSSGNVHRYYHYTTRPKNIPITRPRLNAYELEEKVINELKSTLVTAGYFQNMEKSLESEISSSTRGDRSEFNRIKNELDEVNEQIRAIWTSQRRMQLSEECPS